MSETSDEEMREIERRSYCLHGFILGCPDCDYPAMKPSSRALRVKQFGLPEGASLAEIQTAGRVEWEKDSGGESWADACARVKDEPYRKAQPTYGTPEWHEQRRKFLEHMNNGCDC